MLTSDRLTTEIAPGEAAVDYNRHGSQTRFP